MQKGRIVAVCCVIFLVLAIRSGHSQTTYGGEQNSHIRMSPAKIDFGNQEVGTSSEARTITLSNDGETELNVDDVLISGIDFSQTNTCGTTLAAGATCMVKITFRPAISGPRMGTLLLFDSARYSPQMATLAGSGEQHTPTSEKQTDANQD